MKWTSSLTRCRRYTLAALALTLAVCLTACSMISDDAKAHTALAEAVEAPKKVPLANDVKTPDVPKHLVKCINKEPPKGKDANEMVTNQILTAEERKACAKAILAWYKQIQAANKKTTPKPTS